MVIKKFLVRRGHNKQPVWPELAFQSEGRAKPNGMRPTIEFRVYKNKMAGDPEPSLLNLLFTIPNCKCTV